MRTERLMVAFGIGAVLVRRRSLLLARQRGERRSRGCHGHGRRSTWRTASRTCKACGAPSTPGLRP